MLLERRSNILPDCWTWYLIEVFHISKNCCSVFFIASQMALFSVAIPLPQWLSMKLTISLLLKNTIDLLGFFWDINSMDSHKETILKIKELQYIVLFVVSGCSKKIFWVGCVNIYFSQSIVNYLFAIALKVWGYPTLLVLWFINFKMAFSCHCCAIADYSH